MLKDEILRVLDLLCCLFFVDIHFKILLFSLVDVLILVVLIVVYVQALLR